MQNTEETGYKLMLMFTAVDLYSFLLTHRRHLDFPWIKTRLFLNNSYINFSSDFNIMQKEDWTRTSLEQN